MPALAHRLALRPELWVQRLRPEDIVLELLDRVPTPAPRPRPSRQPSDPRGDAEARRLRRARRRSACSRRSCSAGPELGRPRGAVRAAARRRALARRAVRGSRRSSSSTPSARSRASRSRRELELRAETPVARLELLLDLPRGPRRARRRTRSCCGSPPGERRELDLPAPLRALGRLPRRRLRAARAGPLRPARLRADARAAAAAEGLPARRGARSGCCARSRRRRSPATRSPRVRGEGIEFADLRPVRARRPHPPHQLARDRAARRALGQRDASRSGTPTSSSSSTPSPRPAPARAARSTSPCEAAGLARGALPPARRTASASSRFGGVLELADGLERDRPALPRRSTRCSTPRSSSATRGRTST